MFMNLLICGAANFQSEEQDEEIPMSLNSSPSSTPRRSRFCKSSHNNNRDKNPYATRGLDKFSALLADLEEKRQRIYAENASDSNVPLVRFVYKNSNDLVPVVIKLKHSNDNNNKKKESKTKTKTINTSEDHVKEIQPPQDKFPIETRLESDDHTKKAVIMKGAIGFSWSGLAIRLDRLRRPSYYLPIVVIMILVLLAIFGRSVAILCTSIGWYVVPTLKESSSKKRSSTKKKVYVKRLLSDKRMISEGSNTTWS